MRRNESTSECKLNSIKWFRPTIGLPTFIFISMHRNYKNAFFTFFQKMKDINSVRDKLPTSTYEKCSNVKETEK